MDTCTRFTHEIATGWRTRNLEITGRRQSWLAPLNNRIGDRDMADRHFTGDDSDEYYDDDEIEQEVKRVTKPHPGEDES